MKLRQKIGGLWHRVDTVHECVKPSIFGWKMHRGRVRRTFSARALLHRLWWGLLWHAGLGCAGGQRQPITKHLRTDFCEWMRKSP